MGLIVHGENADSLNSLKQVEHIWLGMRCENLKLVV